MQSLPRPIPLEAPQEAHAEPETEEAAPSCPPEAAEVAEAATVVVAGPDTPPKSPGAEPSLGSPTDLAPSIRAPSSEQLSVMSDGEGALMSEKSLLDPQAAPPAPPSEFPVTVRATRPLSLTFLSFGCSGLHTTPALPPPCLLAPRAFVSLASRALAVSHTPVTHSRPLSQLALLDVVRQSHVLAGAIVGVCCGTLYSLRKLSSGLRR